MMISTLRTSFQTLLGLLLATAAIQPCEAQTMSASKAHPADLGCVIIGGCGTVDAPGQAIDSDVTTAANISPPLVLSSAALMVSFGETTNPMTIPKGSLVKVMLSVDGGGLNVGLLGQTSLRTYNTLTGPAQQNEPLNSTGLTVNLLANNKRQVEFLATAPFKYLELRTGGVLNAVVGGYSVNLYMATVTMAAPLPVELVSFAGKAHGTAVDLTWETASEHNSAYFQVERSTVASDSFQAVGEVAAAGSSTARAFYKFSDARPLAFGYYRLRQVDADGKTAFSPIVAVSAKPLAGLQAYPNPAATTTTITGPAGAQYTLFNQLGQAVRAGELPLNQTSELNLGSLPGGLYFLREKATGTTIKVLKTAGNTFQ